MSRNYYSEINLHVVWHTKANQPLLAPEIELDVHTYLRKRLFETEGVFLHEIGGTSDHLHLCMTVPPTLTVSQFIGQLKGASSHEINHNNPDRDKILEWQTGFSCGTKDVPWVKRYIANQKQHHSRGSLHDRLERITAPNE